MSANLFCIFSRQSDVAFQRPRLS